MRSRKNILLIVASILFILVVAVRLLFYVRIIPTPSMENTLGVGSIVVFSKTSEVQYKDIVLFSDKEGNDIVKRVIGIGGDIIEIKKGTVFRNNLELGEDYAKGTTKPDGTYIVPDNTIFVLGDNRENSKDSRFIEDPYIEVSHIKGKAWWHS